MVNLITENNVKLKNSLNTHFRIYIYKGANSIAKIL